MTSTVPARSSPPGSSTPRPVVSGLELALFALVLLLAVLSRTIALGERAVSHDETSHIYYAWTYAQGEGYQHTPITHGPLQFHLIALSYLVFGDSEFSARLPHALASILTILLLWKWRSYLGRSGMLISALLVLISPFMLYYGRYARNEAFVALLGLASLYALLRYLESGRDRYLLLLTASTALHFATKETAFIYTAQALLFLGLLLLRQLLHREWPRPALRQPFLILLGAAFLLSLLAFVVGRSAAQAAAATGEALPVAAPGSLPVLIGLATAGFLLAAYLLVRGASWQALAQERSFSLIVLLTTFTLPQLSAILLRALGANPLDYAFSWPGWNFAALWAQGPVRTGAALLLMGVLSAALGLAWDRRRWPLHALLFWGIFAGLYTSLFSYWEGFFTGIVGSLGYWLEQHTVQRGGQPWYYYLLIQLPLYEFLPVLGALLAAFLRLDKALAPPPAAIADDRPPAAIADDRPPVFGLLAWWAVSALIAYSAAGEKMPWLSVHISLPLILLAGLGLGQLVERIDILRLRRALAGTALPLVALAAAALFGTLHSWLGVTPPFQGKGLAELRATGAFLLQAIVFLACLVALLRAASIPHRLGLQAVLLACFAALALLTVRSSFRAAFKYPDQATEYLVYAHGAGGIESAMRRVQALSERTARGRDIAIAYDGSAPDSGVAWPLQWYLRAYPNAIQFLQVDESLRSYPVVLADERNADELETLLGREYLRIDYLRMIWPNQDYFDLTWVRLREALQNRAARAAIYQIWSERDYQAYAGLYQTVDPLLASWEPSDRMSLFLRRSLVVNLWEDPQIAAVALEPDPYEGGRIPLTADKILGACGTGDGQLQGVRGFDFAPDGRLYVADALNHRIAVFSASGDFLTAWGAFGDASTGLSSLGSFNEPWDVAIAPDGGWLVVVDTWNHRIQKFLLDGTPLTSWGSASYDPAGSDPYGLWGPRAAVIDRLGRVFVADTGNKRILVYDQDGIFLMQIGQGGMGSGEFEEPVGLEVDADGQLYVADTWNRRIQVFAPRGEAGAYEPVLEWEVDAWSLDTIDNKPYLALDARQQLLVTDPESARVLAFSTTGLFLQTWGEYGTGSDQFGLASGIGIAPDGRIWVSDARNCRLLAFTLP